MKDPLDRPKRQKCTDDGCASEEGRGGDVVLVQNGFKTQGIGHAARVNRLGCSRRQPWAADSHRAIEE